MAEKSTQQYFRSSDVNQKLLSSIDNGVIILDDSLVIHYYNHWLEIHTSLKESTLLNKKITDIFPTINTKTLLRKIKTALRMGTPTFYTATTSKYLIPIKITQLSITGFKEMRQDVSVIPFDIERRLVALIITDQTNMIHTNLLLESHIKKIKELNSELVKERETIDKKVLLIKFNTESIITNVSQAYLSLLDCLDKDLLLHNFFEYQKLYITKELKSEMFYNMEEQIVFNFEHTMLSLMGKELTLHCTLVPEYDSYTQHIGFILFMQDITHTKKVIEQQEELLSTSRSAAMGEMISMIAHQWRQPLSVINTIIGTIKIKQELDTLKLSTLNDSFQKIEETVSFLSTTIDDFKNYFKPNKVIDKISILEIVDKSNTFLVAEMKLSSIFYTQNIDAIISIKTYKNELIQCIINILKNSIDAFKENSSVKKKTISIIGKKHTSSISLLFQDNAGGIKKEIIKKVFEPYFSTKAKNGTGLGLYMTKTIIEDHLNGKITLTSKQDKTSVLVELPYFIQNTKEIK